MLIVGITGGTGVGKSTLLDVFKNKGAFVIDCDTVYHELLGKPGEMNDALNAAFPAAFHEGKLNTKTLGELVFDNKCALERLKLITHPYVVKEVKKIICTEKSKGNEFFAIDAFGLTESGLSNICNIKIAVTAPIEDRVRRITNRDSITEEYARKRVLSQKTDIEYMEECDYTLVNNCSDKEAFKVKCFDFIKNILEV